MYEVKYNKRMNRWEVFRHGRNIIRGGEVQPVFVSALVFVPRKRFLEFLGE